MSIGQPAVPTPLADPAAAVLALRLRPAHGLGRRRWSPPGDSYVWVRDPLGLMTVLGMPVLTMIMFKVVLGEVVGSSTVDKTALSAPSRWSSC